MANKKLTVDEAADKFIFDDGPFPDDLRKCFKAGAEWSQQFTHIVWNEIRPDNMPTLEGYQQNSYQILLIDEKHNIWEGAYMILSKYIESARPDLKPTHWSYVNYPPKK